MSSITQELAFRQRMMKYLQNHGVIETANRFHVCRKTVWKYRKRWDGTPQSLANRSRRPHTFPRAQSEAEIALVQRMRKKYGSDLIQAYQQAKAKGYTRSYGCFKRTARRILPPTKPPRKRKNKPYQRAAYPGEKVQVDVKYVPSACAVDQRQYYVYCAKDECSRWTYRKMYAGHSTHSSEDFLRSLVKNAPFLIREVQADNGPEFTKALLAKDRENLTLFERLLQEYGTLYHRIRPATPRHNGKVERGNRTDELRFYSKLRMFSLQDGQKQLAVYQHKSNNIIMTCLKMRSPSDVVADDLALL